MASLPMETCRRGHARDPENIYVYDILLSDGRKAKLRVCKDCGRIRQRRREARLAAERAAARAESAERHPSRQHVS